MTTMIIDSQLLALETDQGTMAFVVLMEDELIHTDDHTFCADETCPCKAGQNRAKLEQTDSKPIAIFSRL